MPKVVYFINAFDLGGAELGLVQLAKGGVFAGCDLKIVAIARGRGGLEAQLEALGHTPEILVDRPRMRMADLPRAIARFARLLKREQPDMLILSLPQANLIGRLATPRRPRPIVASFEHNTHLAKPLYEIGYRWTSPRVDWLLADSENTAREAARRLYRRVPQETTIVPLLALTGEPGRPSSQRGSDAFHIVNAARFTPVKNQGAIIEALALLTARGHAARLTLYGDGPSRAGDQALAHKLGLEEHVEFAGFVADWTRQPADLFVLSSRHEGLCMAVLQAMHAGIPVAAPLIGGLRDYAGPQVMTVLASAEPRAIAHGIEAIMKDRQSTCERAAAAAQMAEARYGQAAVTAAYRAINRKLHEKCGALHRA